LGNLWIILGRGIFTGVFQGRFYMKGEGEEFYDII
jgi:hypothetical protein